MPISKSEKSLDQLLDENQEIWVFNQIEHVIPLHFDESTNVTIPPEKRPFNLSGYLPPSSIRNSASIRKMVTEGTLLLLDSSQLSNVEKIQSANSLARISRARRNEDASLPQSKEFIPEGDLEYIHANDAVAILGVELLAGRMHLSEVISKLRPASFNENDWEHLSTLRHVGLSKWCLEQLQTIAPQSSSIPKFKEIVRTGGVLGANDGEETRTFKSARSYMEDITYPDDWQEDLIAYAKTGEMPAYLIDKPDEEVRKTLKSLRIKF